MIKALGFDWDGTLVDLLPVKIESIGRIFNSVYGANTGHVRYLYTALLGMSRREQFDIILSDCCGVGMPERDFERMSAMFDIYNSAGVVPEALYPETKQVLASQPRDRIVYLSTSAPANVVGKMLDYYGIAEHFSDVLGYDTYGGKGVGHSKHIMQKYGLRPEELLFVGDTAFDIELHHQAGVRIVCTTRTTDSQRLLGLGAHATVDDLRDLEAIVQQL